MVSWILDRVTPALDMVKIPSIWSQVTSQAESIEMVQYALIVKLEYTVELQDLPTLKRTIVAQKPVWKQRKNVI